MADDCLFDVAEPGLEPLAGEPEVCRRCHRPLKDPVSLGFRIGPDCREHLGITVRSRGRLRVRRPQGPGLVAGQGDLLWPGDDEDNEQDQQRGEDR